MHIAVAHLLIDQAHLINYTYQNSIDMMKKLIILIFVLSKFGIQEINTVVYYIMNGNNY